MRTYQITHVRETNGMLAVTYTDGGDDPAATQETHLTPDKVDAFMAEYGFTDPIEALDGALHTVPVREHLAGLDPRDDPAAVAGWVTTTGPDAEPIQCYTARSTVDARGAYQARMDAAKAEHYVITDPDGLLPAAAERFADATRHAAYRELVDVNRWGTVYGGLPLPEPRPAAAARIPIQARG